MRARKCDTLKSCRWPVTELGQLHLPDDGLSASWWVAEIRMERLYLHCKVHPGCIWRFPAKRNSSRASVWHVPTDTEHADFMFRHRCKFFLYFFLCCRLASSELNIKKILQRETTRPADCFFPKWMRWWVNAFIYINNQLKGPHWMWAFIFDDILIVTINNNIFIVG